tara:strand:- start:949 stop:1863 length:915 start_codon:yes stop_codon:yes gene_type:complete
MLLNPEEVSVIITTFNRKRELGFTLNSLRNIIPLKGVFICDDASTDGTVTFLDAEFPEVNVFAIASNQGLIANRNFLLKQVSTEYVISIDDDANFLVPDALKEAISFMKDKNDCAVLSFRLFWGFDVPEKYNTTQVILKVKNYLGGAHLMRKSAWDGCIESYPDWYKFYGEEDYASLRLFNSGWKIFYFPEVLVHHRVSIKNRSSTSDSLIRSRRALHAAWSNYLIFYPRALAYKKVLYSIKEQLRIKFIKGDFKILKALFLAAFDLKRFSDKRKELNTRLTKTEMRSYSKIPEAPIYWKVEDE